MAKYNCVTSGAKAVSRKVNAQAFDFINACGFYTPEREAELDRLLGLGTMESNEEPDPEILLDESAFDNEWLKREPTIAELKRMERLGA